jgi:hypothetical protein
MDALVPGMRSTPLWALLLMAGCGAAPAPAEVPVVTIAPVAQAAPEASASAASDPQAASAAPAAPASAAPSDAEKIARELAELDTVPMAVLSGGVTTGLAVGPAAQGGGLHLGGGGGVVGPGRPGGLAAIGGGGSGTPGPAPAPAVIGRASIKQVGVKGGKVANAEPVVAGMAAGFRRCFNKGLQDDPHMKGSVTLTVAVGANGEVLSVVPSAVKALSGKVVSCAAARASSAQFAPPEGGASTLTIPIVFDLAP